MSAIRPTIVIDTREQTPLVFRNLPSVLGTLTSGDYSILGAEELFAVERKSIADLVTCVTRERDRFERELHRLRGFVFARLLICGAELEIENHRYRSQCNPKSVINTLKAFEARYVPVVWDAMPMHAAEQVETWAYWFSREIINTAESLTKAQKEDA